MSWAKGASFDTARRPAICLRMRFRSPVVAIAVRNSSGMRRSSSSANSAAETSPPSISGMSKSQMIRSGSVSRASLSTLPGIWVETMS